MRTFIGLVAILVLSMGCRKDSSRSTSSSSAPELSVRAAEVIARFSFGGFDQLNAGTNAATLKEVWAMPATIALRDLALQKLANVIAGSFQPKTNATAN